MSSTPSNDLRLLRCESGPIFSFFPNSGLSCVTCDGAQINLFEGNPLEGGIANLYVRVHGQDGIKFLPVLGPAEPLGHTVDMISLIEENIWEGLFLGYGPYEVAGKRVWEWRVSADNMSFEKKRVDVIFVQDVGLCGPGASRTNEAFISQYIDHNVLEHPEFGPVLFSRQNQPVDGKFPTLILGSRTGAAGFCTDGLDFYGLSAREDGIPAALGAERLPSIRRQGEFSLLALQAEPILLQPGEEGCFKFFVQFLPDHPEAISPDDLALVDRTPSTQFDFPTLPRQSQSPNLFTTSDFLESRDLTEQEVEALFGAERRHEERDDDGRLLSFFQGDAGTHVVLRAKELLVDRPHGQILLSGSELLPSDARLSTTTWMDGVFQSLVTVGNTRFHRLLGNARTPLNLLRASGQRVFVELGGEFRLLGLPSAWEVGPDFCRWVYASDAETILVEVSVDPERPVAWTDIRTLSGRPLTFVVAHRMVGGVDEFGPPPELRLDREAGRVECIPAAGTPMAETYPEGRFLIGVTDVDAVDAMGGDELLLEDGESRGIPQFVIRTRPTSRLTVGLTGALEGDAPSLPAGGPPARQGEFWRDLLDAVRLDPAAPQAGVGKLRDTLACFVQNAMVHFTAPHGLEQYNGAAWGTRDVCQGPMELLLGLQKLGPARQVLLQVFRHQLEDGDWPQWFMFDRYFRICAGDSHGDVILWPLKALCDYLEAAEDFAILDESVPYMERGVGFTQARESLFEHAMRIVDTVRSRFIPGTSLVSYGEGDWNDSLQPADLAMRERMVSGWTVGLAWQTFRRFAEVCRRRGRGELAAELLDLCDGMREDFNHHLVADGVAAGFAILREDGYRTLLLHPRDKETDIHYRLLPMIRGIIAEMFTPEQAAHHLNLIRTHLACPDGYRLMDRPPVYRGGTQRYFRRAETASYFGREIGLMYVHAHLRSMEALAKLGEADALHEAILKVVPINLHDRVRSAARRQSNAYFSSSDAAFADRYEASERYEAVRAGEVAVKGGWRVYSSGPGIFVHLVVTRFLGIRRHYGDLVLDPVLPRSLDGLRVGTVIDGKDVEVTYHIVDSTCSPNRVAVNGRDVAGLRYEPNPYRPGGAVIALDGLLDPARTNHIAVWL